MDKTCKTCGETKPSAEFHKDRSKPDGLNHYCKPCTIAKQKVYDLRPPRKAAPEGMKRCSRCKQTKSVDEFYLNKGQFDGLMPRCKECSRKQHEQWRLSNLDKAAKQSKKWRDANPRMAKDYKLRSVYGIPLGTYDKMLAAQNGRCLICGTTEPGGKGGDFHVDHCHTSGSVRGLLCNTCNISLGYFDHIQKHLTNILSYLGVKGG